MGGAVGLVGFGAGASINPDADSARLRKGGVFGGDLDYTPLACWWVGLVIEGQWLRTVNPLLKVVLSVVEAWLTGVASARRVMLLGLTALMAR